MLARRSTVRHGATPAAIAEWQRELLGVAAVVAAVLVGVFPLVNGGITAGIDTLDFFYPMFSFLGEQLRAGNIPGWNPYQFSGAPFAADPESGWTYLPAMLFFAALPLEAAARAMMLFHFLLAALSMYALARVIGITIVGAFVAAVAYALSYFFYTRSICCPAHIFVLAWMPVSLLFLWLASRSRSWLPRIWCWGMAGLALSQIVAGWLGQGSYYAFLLAAGFVVYLEVVLPTRPGWSPGRRLGRCAISLAVTFAWAAGFAAAGVLPRVEFVNASNLARGYSGHASTQGGLSFADALIYPLLFGGVAVIVLAVLAPILARRRFMTPYFGFVAGIALLLALRASTPFHWVAYALLPRFEDLHSHASERVLLVFYLAVAILAGAAVSAVRGKPRVSFALTVVVLANLLLGNWAIPLPMSRHLDLEAYYSPRGAAEFLHTRHVDEPFRYFGYDPEYITLRDGQEVRYLWQMFDPRVTSLLVNNRATLLRLEDIQGYNPVQSQRYVEYFDRLNGVAQEYHGRYVLPSGLDSPLLDLLNARYMVIPAEFSLERADLRHLVDNYPVVYQDEMVTVLENDEAFPRAWIVHEARQATKGEALDLLASDAIDARQTALLETPPPPLDAAADPRQDRVIVERHEPDVIHLRARSDGASLLVLSDVFYPAWKAYVDGEPTPIYVANHALRALPLPAGEHLVELRYESATLRIGTIISLLALFAFVAFTVTAVVMTSRTSPSIRRHALATKRTSTRVAGVNRR